MPIAARKLIGADSRSAAASYPAGTVVMPCICLAAPRPGRSTPSPDAFRPERFLDGQPGTYAWIPFGGGVRRCLGASFALLEMRIVVQAVLRNLELRPAVRGATSASCAAPSRCRLSGARASSRPAASQDPSRPGDQRGQEEVERMLRKRRHAPPIGRPAVSPKSRVTI